MSQIAVVITVEDVQIARTGEICADLSRRGLTVEQQHPEIGLIYGRAEARCLADFSRADGVAEARPEDSVALPPMRDGVPQ